MVSFLPFILSLRRSGNFCSIKSKEKSFSLARFEFRTFQRLQQIQFSRKIFPIFFVIFDCFLFLFFFCEKKKFISKNFKKIKISSSFFLKRNEKNGKTLLFLDDKNLAIRKNFIFYHFDLR